MWKARPEVQYLRDSLNPINFGPYTEQQLEYVTQHHRKVYEVGCGSGYLLWVLRERGVAAFGFDPNRYPLMDTFDWTKKLETEGAITRSGPEGLPEDCSDGSLLLSWPEPGALFAYDAIKLYRERGGTSLLLKLGGLVGRHNPSPWQTTSYTPPLNPGGNVRKFFEELANHWKSAPTVAPFVPGLFENNLWAFSVGSQADNTERPRRKSSQQLALERKLKRRTKK